eukprot:CAMPEP_0198286252 /NCGR_PEP_ID=MMETSP1449-20131203/5379_1 /TAXON_ID=420275 /ORGANISM="Attheya septentrionalis, Strain CCMP2084" /LENGTH=992 /DNA_ID=CAMNT_0043983939 /DNA_START=262 /DNA_END=3240 /DNA_ORIENTATION=-
MKIQTIGRPGCFLFLLLLIRICRSSSSSNVVVSFQQKQQQQRRHRHCCLTTSSSDLKYCMMGGRPQQRQMKYDPFQWRESSSNSKFWSSSSSLPTHQSLLHHVNVVEEDPPTNHNDASLEEEEKEEEKEDKHHDKEQEEEEKETAGFYNGLKNRVRSSLMVDRRRWRENEESDTTTPARTVTNVHELRTAVLEKKIPLRDLDIHIDMIRGPLQHNLDSDDRTSSNSNNNNATVECDPSTVCDCDVTESLWNHSVMQLIAERIQTNSTPSNRGDQDMAHLALAIEGGGMRGAVSAGMAAAISSLGLMDAFDSVYGSSAGSIVGAYMISRQMCIDVYTEVLPAAKGRFASKGRVMSNLGVGLVNDLVARLLRERTRTGTGTLPIIAKNNVTTTATSLPVTVTKNETNGRLDDTSQVAVAPDPSSPGIFSAMLSKVLPLAISDRLPVLLSSIRPYLRLSPGMNISFVLDGIMSEQHGLRPFDIQSFQINDAKQPLYCVSSTVRGGQLETVAFGSADGDYWDIRTAVESKQTVSSNGKVVRSAKVVKELVRSTFKLLGVVAVSYKSKAFLRRFIRQFVDAKLEQEGVDSSKTFRVLNQVRRNGRKRSLLGIRRRRRKSRKIQEKHQGTMHATTRLREATSCTDDAGKKGFFACIEASMLVPGAAGKPIKLLRSKHRDDAQMSGVGTMTNICFDAFCYEPIPYRSAVENGATHVLALRTRPAGCVVETVPAMYEKLVAPIYFRLHGMPKVVDFFETGGSQYRYLEDVLTLNEGLVVGCTSNDSSTNCTGVKVPPTKILYGITGNGDDKSDVDTNTWKRAHLLPVVLPAGTPELPNLTQEKDEVLSAVRNGYAAAFDMLAPVAGLEFDPSTVESKRVAELLFPKRDDEDIYVLGNPIQVKGEVIERKYEQERQKEKSRFIAWIREKRNKRKQQNKALQNPIRSIAVKVEEEFPDTKQYVRDDSLDWLEAEALLAALPGFQQGRLSHLSVGLRSEDSTS